MAALKILGAGAAQRVIGELAAACIEDGWAIQAQYGGVHAIAARIASGEPADVVVLTGELLDELADAGVLEPGSRHDLGTVETAIAVRAGTQPPDVSTPEALRAALLAATTVVCPDPAVATAGRAFAQVMERLGVRDAVAPRLVACANGEAAARRLAVASARDLGVMQVTEVLAHPGVALAGRLPAALGRATLYGAAVSSGSGHRDDARDFIRRLAGARSLLRSAGFSPCPLRA